jgi:hypothetical protein
MASTIGSLANLAGYIKSRDLVVVAAFPRMDAEPKHPGFLPRPLPHLEFLSPANAKAARATGSDGLERSPKPPKRDLELGNPEGFQIFD